MGDAPDLIETHSAAFLPEASALRRALRVPSATRPQAFLDAFEDRALVYDCFWHQDGDHILMVGPPPMNLAPAFENANFYAEPSGKRLLLQSYATLSQAVHVLAGPPPGTTHVRLGSGDVTLPVMPNHSHDLAGARVLFSMNKNNDLAWIGEWARFHARHHGTDTVILFDNGSTRYGTDEVRATLKGVEGIAHAIVPNWPYRFGALDGAVKTDPYWSHFLQNASMSVVLRRYAARARGLLNLDIDELAAPGHGSLYDAVERSLTGLLTFKGRWVEAITEADAPGDHRAFTHVHADPALTLCRASKWVLDPKRRWVRKPSVQPYWHWIAGRPFWAKQRLADRHYWHFRGINTNWKQDRTGRRDGETRPDTELVAAFS